MAVITLSRQYASGGDEVADHLCGLLHYRYFDRRLIAEVATEIRPATGEPSDFTEDQYWMPTVLDRLLNRPPRRRVAVTEASTEGATGIRSRESATVDAETAIALEWVAIEAAYNQGSVVIVGRGGQAILHGRPGVLHVRIEAPLESRIRRLREAVGFTPYAAKQEILARDQTTAAYLKRFYGVDWSDSTLYHLIINTDLLGISAAARLIVSAVECLRQATRSR
jgi:CMP/dCMP kinase